jgi:hypothetical protein
MNDTLLSYEALLSDLKNRILSARSRSALAVNRELVLLYWQIGREILARQEAGKWGAKVIERTRAILADPDSPAVPRLEAEINGLVYELYRLKEEEIAIVEGKEK